MLESLLKFALSYKDAFDNHEENPDDHSLEALIDSLQPSFEKYNSEDLNDTINMSCKAGLIDEARKKQLHEFRKSLRNAYSHADRKKIHQDKKIPIQAAHMTDEGKFEVEPEEEHRILDMPFMHGFAQHYHAKANALPYFLHVDALVREIKPKVFQGLDPSANDSTA
jgi:hypothetical protein